MKILHYNLLLSLSLISITSLHCSQDNSGMPAAATSPKQKLDTTTHFARLLSLELAKPQQSVSIFARLFSRKLTKQQKSVSIQELNTLLQELKYSVEFYIEADAHIKKTVDKEHLQVMRDLIFNIPTSLNANDHINYSKNFEKSHPTVAQKYPADFNQKKQIPFDMTQMTSAVTELYLQTMRNNNIRSRKDLLAYLCTPAQAAQLGITVARER